MGISNFLLRHRKGIRIVFYIVTLLVFILANYWVYQITDAGPIVFISILIPVITFANEFAPEIFAYIGNRFGPSEYEQFMVKAGKAYADFTERHFNYRVTTDEKEARYLDLFSYLNYITRQVEGRPFGSTIQKDARRRLAVILLFLLKNNDVLAISDFENLLSFVKNSYRALTDKAREEFINGYSQIVLEDKQFVNVENYFDVLSESEYEKVRLQFFDRYMKDDFIKEITGLLNMKDSQINSFKASVQAVAESNEFNINYLKEFVNSRKTYRKLFIVASRTHLPKAIQLWIRQQPHFILRPSSIANLPILGVSNWFNIFFFSPSTMIPSAQALYEKLCLIDDKVEKHPLRIYEIDPSESKSVGLDTISEFSQAITYFETSAISGDDVEAISYNQMLSLLEHRNVSLLEIISELSPAEYASSVLPEEKTYLNTALSQFIGDNDQGVFALTGVLIKDVKAWLKDEKNIQIDYSPASVVSNYSGKVTLAKKRARLLDLFREIQENLKQLCEFLV